MSLLKTLKFIYQHPLNKDKKIKSLCKFFKWQIASRLIHYPIIYPFTEKSKLMVTRGMSGATGNFYCGLVDFSEMSFLLHFLREDELFVDIGANVGSYTILASAHVGAYSISFEPINTTYQWLKCNILINNISDKVKVYNKAVGSRNEKKLMTNNLDTVNFVTQKKSKNTVEIEVVRLDEILISDNPVLLKIDVEGYEAEVLKGAKETLNKNSLKAIIIELNGLGKRYGYRDRDIHDFLMSMNFYPYYYDAFERNLIKLTDFKNNNIIYIRDINFVTQRLLTAEKININNILY